MNRDERSWLDIRREILGDFAEWLRDRCAAEPCVYTRAGHVPVAVLVERFEREREQQKEGAT